MIIHSKHRFITIILVSVMFAWLGFSTCGISLAAEKPEYINVVLIADFTGPHANITAPLRSGAEDVWKYINETLGGIQGVKVRLLLRDIAGKVDIGLAQYSEVVNINPKPLFIDIIQTSLSPLVRERYVQDGVIGFHTGSVDCVYPPANSYAYFPLYQDQAAMLLKWAKDNWKEKRNLRIGILTWDNPYGKAILKDEVFAFAKNIGVEIVDTQLFATKEIDVTAQAMKLRALKPDYLLTNSCCGGLLAVKKQLKEMGWSVPMLNGIGGDWTTVRLDQELFEGDITIQGTKSFDETEDPSIKAIMELFKANGRDRIKDIGFHYLTAWQDALVEHKVMTEVVNKYGWQGLNVNNLKRTLNSLKDFEPLHGLTKITYTEERRTPTFARIFKTTNGKLLPITGFLEVPDMRPVK